MKKRPSVQDRGVLVLGVVAVVLGLLLNVWFVSFMLGRPILNPGPRIMIFGFDVATIMGGSILIKFGRSIGLRRLLLLAASGSVSAIVLVGIDFRLGSVLPARSVTYIDDLHRSDDALGWTLQPGSVAKHFFKGNFDVEYDIDEDGLKRVDNPPDTDFDIYFFGDSFTFGHGVTNESTFPNIIASEHLNGRVGVYNCGIMGYGIVQQVQRLLLLSDRLHEGDVVVFSPLAEDMDRNFDTFGQRAQLLNLMISKKDETAAPLAYYPCFNDGAIEARKIESDGSPLGKLKSLAINAPFTGGLFRRMLGPRTKGEDVITESRALLELARQRTESRGARFVLMFLPRTEECLAGQFPHDISAFGSIDLMEYFPTEKSDLERIVFKTDAHWNEAGHRLAAHAVVDALVDEGVIEGRYLKNEFDGAPQLVAMAQ